MTKDEARKLECPDCRGQMMKRTNRRTGEIFYGCRRYPVCQGTRNEDGEAKRQARESQSYAPSERAARNDRQRWRHES